MCIMNYKQLRPDLDFVHVTVILPSTLFFCLALTEIRYIELKNRDWFLMGAYTCLHVAPKIKDYSVVASSYLVPRYIRSEKQ